MKMFLKAFCRIQEIDIMKFGYSIIFVDDVTETVAFYERAFGVQAKLVTQAFAQLDTGTTSIAFGSTENEAKELGAQTFRRNSLDIEPAGAQISFISEDVEADYGRAISAGAHPVYPPKQMPWGQWVSRVRDCNGFLVSIVTAPPF
jgi:lactoylglutathione lyase